MLRCIGVVFSRLLHHRKCWTTDATIEYLSGLLHSAPDESLRWADFRRSMRRWTSVRPDSAIMLAAFVCATCQCNGSEAANLDIQQL